MENNYEKDRLADEVVRLRQEFEKNTKSTNRMAVAFTAWAFVVAGFGTIAVFTIDSVHDDVKESSKQTAEIRRDLDRTMERQGNVINRILEIEREHREMEYRKE